MFDFSGQSPFQNVLQTYFGSFDGLAQAYEPVFKGYARWQLEVLSLTSRRAQAYLELPSRVAQCRTPQDLANEQMLFWQTAYQHYTDSTQRMLLAISQIGPSAQTAQPEAPRERDYMTVSDPKEPAAAPPRFTERERKVA
jgi:hypothetical protein